MITIARKISTTIENWVTNSRRKVLLLRGARQVGKTYVVRKAGERFKHFLEINFLSDTSARTFFDGDLDVERITEKLAAFYRVPIVDGETLLFFDEVQACPRALEALRFFYEKRPNLHLIASGSLLEFALAELPSFGVGRVQSMYLYAVSFDEFLLAAGERGLVDYLQEAGPKKPSGPALHGKFLDYLKTYLFLGGLPEVIATFLTNKDYQAITQLLDTLRRSYEDDFAKYRGRVPEARLQEVFQSTAVQSARKFVHSHAYPDASAKQVAQAIELLSCAGIVHKVYHSSSNGVPLGGEIDNKKFKAMPFDHGVYQRMVGSTIAELVHPKFDPINKGALAEVYAGAALLANSDPLVLEKLFYWHRESKSSNAEVDYVISVDGDVIPIEIKAATKGRMQSLQRFVEEKKSNIAIRCSMEDFGRFENILVVPLYAISQIPRLVRAR